MSDEMAATLLRQCSFCGASSDSVERLFTTPTLAVCDGCIRSLADAEAKDVPPSPSPVAPLVGRWIKRSDDAVSVSLYFTEQGLLFSTVRDGSMVTDKLLRYSLDGGSLSTVEMVPCGTRSNDTIELAGDVMT